MEEESRPVAFVSFGLIMANIAVFALMFVQTGAFLFVPAEALIAFGGLSALDVWNGEVWRLVTALFVHGGVWHVGLNLWVLFVVGEALERNLGSARTLLIYLVAGIVGGATSILWRPALSVGASGAILGLVGALFAVAYASRGQVFSKAIVASLRPFVFGTLAIGILLPFVDNAAHIGGFVAGFLLGYALITDENPAAGDVALKTPRFAVPAMVLSLGLTGVITVAALRPDFSPRYAASMSFDAAGRGELEEAKERIAQTRDAAPDDVPVLMALARIAAVEGDADTARRYLSTVLGSYDDDAWESRMRQAFLDTAQLRDPYESAPTLSLLFCDVMLKESAPPTGELMNNCAWLMVKDDPARGSVPRAEALAARAVKTVVPARGAVRAANRDEASAFLHTWATALARAERWDDAVAAIDRIEAQGLGMRPVFSSDRADFIRRRNNRPLSASGRVAPATPTTAPLAPLRGPDDLPALRTEAPAAPLTDAPSSEAAKAAPEQAAP